MKRYRIRRGTDQAWLADTGIGRGQRVFWTDIPSAAVTSPYRWWMERIVANRGYTLEGIERAMVEEDPAP